MPLFRYEIMDSLGKRKIESSEAIDREAVLSTLQNNGVILIRWLEDRPGPLSFLFKIPHRRARILKQAQLMQFTKDLAHLLKADIPMDRALGIIESSAEEKGIETLVGDMKKLVREGAGLSKAMATMPADFSPLYINMVRVGEEGGVLSSVLTRLAGFLERSEEIRRYIISTSIYPAILLFVGIVSVFIIMGFVVPRFAGIFNDLGQKMPLSTRVLVYLSLFLQQWWQLLVSGCLLGVMLIWRLSRTVSGKAFIDRWVIKSPLLGRLIVDIQVALFARTLGTLIQSDVPILKALHIVKEILNNKIFKDNIEYIADQVRQGERISRLMKEKKMFPPMVVQMAALGEESGRLGEMLEAAANDLDIKNQSRIKNLLALMEPVAILGMSVIIGGIVVSMLSTIFGINEINF